MLLGWTIYNIPILLAGIRARRRPLPAVILPPRLPKVSLLIAARDEEKVIGRAIESVLNSDYPRDLLEVIVVESGSVDRTREICEDYARRHPRQVIALSPPAKTGKPAALNHALRATSGSIIAVIDADAVIDPEAVKRAVAHLANGPAIQGINEAVNPDESFLSKVVALEEKAWFHFMSHGREALGLFVPIAGSNFYVRSDALHKLKGWDDHALAEDVDLAARLYEAGYRVRFAADVRAWQEVPQTLPILIKQRARWYRGHTEVAIKYGRLVKRWSLRALDAEVVLGAPILMTLSALSYLVWLASLFYPTILPPSPVNPATLAIGLTLFVLSAIGAGVLYVMKPRRLRNLYWVPFIYAYWLLQAGIACFATFKVVLRRPRVWVRTNKTGYASHPLGKTD